MIIETGVNNPAVLEQMLKVLPSKPNLDLAYVVSFYLSKREINHAFTYWKMVNYEARQSKHVGKNKTTMAHRSGSEEALYGISKKIVHILQVATQIKKSEESGLYDIPTECPTSERERQLVAILKAHAQCHAENQRKLREAQA